MKKHYRIKNLSDPISIREACSEVYFDNIYKNDIDFKDVKLKNTKLVKVNDEAAGNEYLTPKYLLIML